MSMNPFEMLDKRRKPSFWKFIGVYIALLLLYILCMLPAYYLCQWIFSFTGHPGTLASLLIIAAIGIAIAFILFRLLGILAHKFGHHHERKRYVPNVLNETFDALDRIAEGDFDVLIEQDEYGYYNELVTRINKMAQDLKSLEHLRQDFVSNVSHSLHKMMYCNFSAGLSLI